MKIRLFAICWLFLSLAAFAGTQNITAEQGARLQVTLTGSNGTLTGRTLRMHVRSSVSDITTKLTASTSDSRLAVASSSTATLDIPADVMASVPVENPTEAWVYDVESYTSSTDVRREWSGRFTITRDVTRDTEADEEDRLAGLVRYDTPQSLTTAQKLQARENIGAGTGGGGDAAAWGAITGTLSDQTDLTAALALKAPLASPTLTGTPAAPTAAGGTSTTQIATTAFTAGEIATHSALTTGAHGITAAGAALIDDASASAQRTTLGLGTAAVESASSFAATSHNHAASDITSGTLALARGGTAASLSDPNADRIMFWDDSAGAVDWLTAGSGLTISGTTISASGGGLTRFTEAESTSSPNATIYVDSLTAAASSTSADIAIVPKANGALLRQVPDGTSTAGNKRGTMAVDWQGLRLTAAQVASGAYAVISGGVSNTASGQQAFVGSGQSNVASGTYTAVPGGTENTASGTQANVNGGYQNTASGEGSVISGGYGNTTSGIFSWVPGGYQATTRGLWGARAYSSGRRSANGDAQVIGQPVRITTSSTSATTLTADGGTVQSYDVMVLPNSSACLFIARVAAYSPGAGDAGAWEVRGLMKRGANAASTALVGSVTATTIAADAGIGSPTVTVIADTTQGAPVIRVTPADSDSTYWVGDLECIQVL